MDVSLQGKAHTNLLYSSTIVRMNLLFDDLDLGKGPLKTIWPSFAYPIARLPAMVAWYRSFAMLFWVGEEDIFALLFHEKGVNLQMLSSSG